MKDEDKPVDLAEPKIKRNPIIGNLFCLGKYEQHEHGMRQAQLTLPQPFLSAAAIIILAP